MTENTFENVLRQANMAQNTITAYLYAVKRSMTQIEGQLLLTGIAPQPMRVFRASGIDKLVKIKEAVS